MFLAGQGRWRSERLLAYGKRTAEMTLLLFLLCYACCGHWVAVLALGLRACGWHAPTSRACQLVTIAFMLPLAQNGLMQAFIAALCIFSPLFPTSPGCSNLDGKTSEDVEVEKALAVSLLEFGSGSNL